MNFIVDDIYISCPKIFLLLTTVLIAHELAVKRLSLQLLNKEINMKATAVGLFLLVLVACGGYHPVRCSSTPGNETDRLSLLEFKKAISDDPQQALASWNDTTHFCNWEGVMCRSKGSLRVTSLDFSNRRLVGHISPSLGNLTFLTKLFLPDNVFTGQIPPSLGQLRHLQTIILSNNTLHGAIPPFANCSDLKVLLLNGNNLVGEFPDLPFGLQKLELSFNKLSGGIPSSLANITTLQQFGCMSNDIYGTIPDEFAKFPELQILNAAGNHLAGRFPEAILNLSTLVALSLAKNYFSGEVLLNLGSFLPNIQILALDMNFFHGHIPSSLANASGLNNIDMSQNNFTGVVPTSIGKLRKLYRLNLGSNNLEAQKKQDWDFVYSLGNCTKLKFMSVAANQLEGHVPTSLGNLSVELQQLYLGINQLSGSFPSGIANFPNLFMLSLYGNQFTGEIPQWIGTLKSLQAIDIGSNNFTGFIPPSLSNLSQLAYLGLGSNKFEGHLSTSIGNLQNLQECDLSHNLLRGDVPKEIFGILTIFFIDLSVNNLHGQLPYEVGKAKQLIYLNLSSNILFGDIPNTLGDCESLEYIDFHQNSFGGSIPITLGNISGLKVLNLSHNNLTGSIPMPLGNLQYLEQVDLSFNNLNGEVPMKGIFSNVSAMRIDGNLGLCGGAMELHLPACSPVMTLNSSMHKKSIFKKLVIPLASMASLAILISVLLLWKRRKMAKSVTLPSFDKKYPQVSYNELERATEDFSASNLIGKGRFSSVYQGILFQERIVVAIKIFSLETKGAQKSFMAECNALRNVRHRNLVPILTVCSSIDSNGNDFKALVYEFMPGGDLHVFLYSIQDHGDTSNLGRITLAQRLCIMVDIADALEYLHHNNQETIVHCDIKPSNILLDENMTAHVGDFGLARYKVDSTGLSSTSSVSNSSIAIKGTIGYLAPGNYCINIRNISCPFWFGLSFELSHSCMRFTEHATGAGVSCAGDVYSFGIVLLEIILRKRPTDSMFKDGLNIANFVEMNFPDRISQIVDPELEGCQNDDLSQEASMAMRERTLACLLSVLDIGLHCTKAYPRKRIDMRQAAARLHAVKEAYLRGN
jgi:serine/threonine protein kinase/Leucine-rich repeat (LRR) protein